jgi:ABC-type uncharacterized transport system YnjBCD substrate-binding protein
MAVLSASTPRATTRRTILRWLTAIALPCGAVACGAAAGDRAGEDRLSREAGAADIAALAPLPWDSVVARARGTTVTWRMWRGDPSINAYVDGWVAPRLRERLGISLEAVDGQGAELVNALVVEREATTRADGKPALDQRRDLRQAATRTALAGPFAQRLPNARFVDSASAIISRDFEQEPLGFESP